MQLNAVLLDIANDLFKMIDKSLFCELKLKEMRDFLDSEYIKHRKSILELRKHPKALEYIKDIVYRMINLLIYKPNLPNNEVLSKFKATGDGEAEVLVLRFLKDNIKYYPDGICSLFTNKEDSHEVYISLVNVVECMGMKSEFSHVNKKDMTFIRTNNLKDIASVCGLYESWILEPIYTERKVTEFLQNNYKFKAK